jgi:hypothetical protein
MRKQKDKAEPDLPMALAQRVEAQLVSDLCCIHCIGQILFVGKHKQNCITQLILQKSSKPKMLHSEHRISWFDQTNFP